MFVIGAKLGSFALLSACAAGGSFLVLVREGANWRFCVWAGRCFDLGAFSRMPEVRCL
ncbi:MAG: hypothetical protein LBO63_07735 [Oscillospiraceae bacterium]|nr:hypothetical protein [Oscillospiraceae bacterium]